MTTISVVTPAYNAEKTILRTINSVLKQSFSDLELIVIDDGSVDKTLELLQTIEDYRLKIFSYENNSERSTARNRGIEKASGDYIAFIDADDLWTSNKLELQLAALQQCPEAGVAYSWTNFINDRDEFLFSAKPSFCQGNVYQYLLERNFIVCGSNILVRRKAIESVGKFDPSLIIGEDWDFNIRLAKEFPFVLVPKYQILYRRSSSSTTSRVNDMEKGTLKIIEKSFQTAPSDLFYLKKRSLSAAYKFFAQLHLEYFRTHQSVRKSLYNLIKSVYLLPEVIMEREVQKLALKLVLLTFFPRSIALSLIRSYRE